VIQHVREKLVCRACEAITQPPAPSHPIARARSGPKMLAHILFAKYGLHLPLHRQSDVYRREGIDLDVSTLADWVGASAATLMPLVDAIRSHVFAPSAFRSIGAAGCGGYIIVRAFGVGIGATSGGGALGIAGSSSCYGRVPGGTSGGARNAWPFSVERCVHGTPTGTFMLTLPASLTIYVATNLWTSGSVRMAGALGRRRWAMPCGPWWPLVKAQGLRHLDLARI
jgi:transposase IS66 family protein